MDNPIFPICLIASAVCAVLLMVLVPAMVVCCLMQSNTGAAIVAMLSRIVLTTACVSLVPLALWLIWFELETPKF